MFAMGLGEALEARAVVDAGIDPSHQPGRLLGPGLDQGGDVLDSLGDVGPAIEPVQLGESLGVGLSVQVVRGISE